MDFGLKGKVLLAAASSDGLGYGIAAKALEEGARVFIGSRSSERVASALASLAKKGEVSGDVLDMASGESISAWVAAALRKYGAVDALLVNAGGPPSGDFETLSEEDWRKAFEVTLLSSVRLIREALPALKKRNGGAILTITSSSVKEPWPGLILSGVMRSGVVSLVKSLSVEFAPYGIRVNNIAPGKIMTARLRQLIASDAEKKRITFEEQLDVANGEIPLGRIGLVEELARTAVFLLSDVSSYITGQTVLVDGGASKSLF